MRKVLFFLILIGAAFAGGAAVNGPGLRWAQTLLFNHPGEAAEGDGPVPEGLVGTAPKARSATGDSPPAPQPVAPVPSLAGESESSRPKEPKAAPPAREPLAADPDALEPKPAAKPSATPEPELPPPLEPAAPSGSNPKEGEPGKAKAPASQTDAAWADLPGSAPAAAVAPRPADPGPVAPASGPAPAPNPRGSTDWSEVRRKMRDLGVSRYGFEGEPSGRVRFHCVIPLAGRRAVGQHFEAEGDDEFQAAQTALRRVALWRATENPAP